LFPITQGRIKNDYLIFRHLNLSNGSAPLGNNKQT